MLAPGGVWVGHYGADQSQAEETGMWIAVVVTLAALALVALFVVPRGGKAEDGPLPKDVETRLLLGERPEDIDRPSRPRMNPPDQPPGRQR